MAKQTLSEHTQRWVVVPTDAGSFAMLEKADAFGTGPVEEAERLAFWKGGSYPQARLATVRITTTIEPD